MSSILCTEATARELVDAMVDITAPQAVEVSTGIGPEGKPALWVNVNGVCVLRACRIDNLSFSTIAPYLEALGSQIERCGRGTHDLMPTRRLWPIDSDAVNVDQWWATYHMSAVMAYRELANEARATLAALKALINRRE